MRWCALLLIAPCLVGQGLAQEGRLDKVREEVNRPSEDSPPSKDKSRSDTEEDDSAEGDLVGLAVLAPFALPHLALNDDFSRDSYFPYFPYQNDHPGYLRFDYADADEHIRLRHWAGRVSLENGNDFDGLNRMSGAVSLETNLRLGVQARFDYMHERLSCGCTDDMFLGATDVTYRFAQSSNMQMYAGLGFRWMDDHGWTRYGFNSTYGADIFPVKPLVLSLSIEAGTLGHAGVFRARGTVGVLYQRFELFGGYDYLSIGGIDLQGPLVGLRLWF
jgi:hypothetical protein